MKWIIGFLLSCVVCSVAFSSGIKVVPTRLELTPRNKIATLTVSNPNTNPILIQTELYDRIEQDGEEINTPTTALVVLPAAFYIPGGQQQQIRIALQQPPFKEAAYRLFLCEIPLNEDTPTVSGLKIALRIGIPIFVKSDE